MRMRSNWNCHTLLIGMQKSYNFGKVSSLNSFTCNLLHYVRRCLPKRNKNVYPLEYLYKNIHSSFIQNGQNRT